MCHSKLQNMKSKLQNMKEELRLLKLAVNNLKKLYNICPDYDEYLKKNRFDKIALAITKTILSVVPFNEKASLNMILIGDCPNIGGNKGYLGWHLNFNFKDYINENYISLVEIKNKLKNEDIKNELELLFNISQEYFIKPIMRIMLEKSDTMFRSEMNRFLNLDKIEVYNDQNGWICRELYERLVHQNLMERLNTKNAYYKTISKNIYQPPDFILPKPQHSILHMTCLKKLEPILEKLNQDTNDIYEIICEYPYHLDGYVKKARADILIKKNGLLYGIIEADGKQHYEYLPHFHNPNNDRKNNAAGYKIFLELQEKDRKKNIASKNICNGKDCLRIKYDTKEPDISIMIKEWLKTPILQE